MQQTDENIVTLMGELQWLGMEGGFWTLSARNA
jgi:hypothetical protein